MQTTRRYQRATKASDIKLNGVEVLVLTNENGVSFVHLVDEARNEVIFRSGDYQGLKVEVPAPPKVKQGYVVVGTVGKEKIPYRSEPVFDYTEAQRKVHAIEDEYLARDIQIEDIEVPEEE